MNVLHYECATTGRKFLTLQEQDLPTECPWHPGEQPKFLGVESR